MPEIASRHHLELRRRGHRRRARDAPERRSTTIETVAVTRGPGLIGALLVGVSAAKALAAARGLPLVPVDHLHGHVRRQHARRPTRSSRRTCAWSQAAGTRSSRASTTRRATRSSARRSTTRPARRSTRARGCSASATRAGRSSTGSRARAIRTAFDFPRSAPGRARLQLQRAQDLAALHAARPSRTAEPRATWPPPTSARSSRRSSAAWARRSSARGCERVAIGGGVAANSELREARARARRAGLDAAAGALHRQRRDDRRRRALPRADRRIPDYLALDAAARLT